MRICLIPARKGSKRVKKKNIVLFFGKPLISWAIKLAKKSKIFDEIIVSTDDPKIAKIAKNFGAKVPFLRPKILSNDYATDNDVIRYFLKNYKKKIDILCYLYPTSVIINTSVLKKCNNFISKLKNFTKLITVCKFPHPVQRSLKKRKNGNFVYLNSKFKLKRTQDLETYYYDAGQCYWFNLKKLKKINDFNKSDIKGIELNEIEFQDINTKNDINLAKIKFKNAR